MPVRNRWWMAVAGVFLQMALGAAYAWSVFRIPLSKEFGWSIIGNHSDVPDQLVFSGMRAVVGGMWMKRVGPRVVAMTAGLLWGGGVFLASFSAHRLWWMYLTYGVIGGTGLGMGYIVPITVLVKWFPDRRGLITGIAVAGFGAGVPVFRAGCRMADPARGVDADVRLSGRGLRDHRDRRWLVHEESSRGLDAGGMDTERHADFAAFGPRLHAGPGAGDMAVVGALRADVDQHDGGACRLSRKRRRFFRRWEKQPRPTAAFWWA